MKVNTLLLIGIWIGLVFGLSFVEAPLKFQAPGITTKLGLGIGKLVFGYSNKIQLILLVVISSGIIYNVRSLSNGPKFLLGLLILIVAFQTLYLLPLLDSRAEQIMNDQSVADTHDHLYFVALEVLKLGSLIFLFHKLSKQWAT